MTAEQSWKPSDDIRRPSSLPTADNHHQNLANERVHVSPPEEVAKRRLQSEIDSPSALVWITDVVHAPQYHTQRSVLVEAHAQLCTTAVGGNADVRLVLADCEAAGDGLDEGFLKVEVTATHVARAVDQERNVGGNRDMGYACTLENDILVVRYSSVKICLHRTFK